MIYTTHPSQSYPYEPRHEFFNDPIALLLLILIVVLLARR